MDSSERNRRGLFVHGASVLGLFLLGLFSCGAPEAEDGGATVQAKGSSTDSHRPDLNPTTLHPESFLKLWAARHNADSCMNDPASFLSKWIDGNVEESELAGRWAAIQSIAIETPADGDLLRFVRGELESDELVRVKELLARLRPWSQSWLDEFIDDARRRHSSRIPHATWRRWLSVRPTSPQTVAAILAELERARRANEPTESMAHELIEFAKKRAPGLTWSDARGWQEVPGLKLETTGVESDQKIARPTSDEFGLPLPPHSKARWLLLAWGWKENATDDEEILARAHFDEVELGFELNFGSSRKSVGPAAAISTEDHSATPGRKDLIRVHAIQLSRQPNLGSFLRLSLPRPQENSDVEGHRVHFHGLALVSEAGLRLAGARRFWSSKSADLRFLAEPRGGSEAGRKSEELTPKEQSRRLVSGDRLSLTLQVHGASPLPSPRLRLGILHSSFEAERAVSGEQSQWQVLVNGAMAGEFICQPGPRPAWFPRARRPRQAWLRPGLNQLEFRRVSGRGRLSLDGICQKP